MKKFVISFFVTMLGLILFTTCGDGVYADLLQERKNEYVNRVGNEKYEDVGLGYGQLNPSVSTPSGKESFFISIGQAGKVGKKAHSVGFRTYANVSYDVTLRPIHTIFYNGETPTGGVYLLPKSNSLDNGRILIQEDATLLVNKTQQSLVLLQNINSGKYIFEMSMAPDDLTTGIKTDIRIWNKTEVEQDIGILYRHDTELAKDDGVPIQSSGLNRGIYIENKKKKVKLTYTYQKYKKNPTNFTGRHFIEDPNLSLSSRPYYGFIPESVVGVGRENRQQFPNDIIGQEVYGGKDTPSGALRQDSEMVAKRAPMSVKPGKDVSLSFTTGLKEAKANPEVIPELDEYEVEEGKTAKISGLWYDVESGDNQTGTIVATWANGGRATQPYTKKNKADIQGSFELNIPTTGMNPGKNIVNLEITDANGNKGNANVILNVLKNIEIQQVDKTTSKIFNRFKTGILGREDEDYSIDLPAVTADKKYILDTSISGYDKKTAKLTDDWTKNEAITGKKNINYFPAPTFTVQTPTLDITEKQNTIIIKGNLVDATKSNGQIDIKKGTKVIGTYKYSQGVGAAPWSITISKDQLDIGENQLTVSMSHAYSDFKPTPIQLTVHRQKKVPINYYLAKKDNKEELLPETALKGLERSVEKRVNDFASIEVNPFLENKKYKFDPGKTGDTNGSIVTKQVKADLNEIKIYYNLNKLDPVPVEVRYENKESGRAVFENLDSEKRKNIKPLGVQEVGTDIDTLITEIDKSVEGYEFDSVKVTSGGKAITNGQVGEEKTVITVLFNPMFEINPPKLEFGSHKISIFNKLIELENNSHVSVINTHENAEGKITPWKLTGDFTGFKKGTEKEQLGNLKYGDSSFIEGRAVTIDSVQTPTVGQKDIKLKDKLKLDVGGYDTMAGEYEGTMTWTLVNAR